MAIIYYRQMDAPAFLHTIYRTKVLASVIFNVESKRVEKLV